MTEQPQNTGVELSQKKDNLKVLGKLKDKDGKALPYEITGYSSMEAEAHALKAREETIKKFEEYSGLERETLEFLIQNNPYVTDPVDIYMEHKGLTLRTKKDVPLVASFWDFNGCLSQYRDGISETKTFVPVLKEAIKSQIDRLGSFIIVSALTSEQMAYHMRKENDIANNVVISSENGRAWLIPVKDGEKNKYVEFQKPLTEKQEKALNGVKDIVSKLCETMRENGLIAFVNKQKFSKCTMEAAGNGKDWYEKTIHSLLLPYLKKNGVEWDGNPKLFSYMGVDFSVSPTVDTWEIDIIEGADKIGKVAARQNLQNTITDIWQKLKITCRHWEMAGGDSFKFNGSDVAITEPDKVACPFAVPNEDKDPLSTLDQMTEIIQYGRKYWPTYAKNQNGEMKLSGFGVAAANYMNTVLDIVPCVKIPTEYYTECLVERLTTIEGFVKTKEYDLSETMLLYEFPEDATNEQKQLFLKAGKDVPQDGESQNKLIMRLREKMNLVE